MASFHCSVKSGKTGSGGAHAEYIEREGKHKSKKEEDLEEVITDNLPEWAEDARDFFRAADEFERVNGNAYREYEIALPRELTKQQRVVLVREFIAQEIGNKHAYTAAIHNPKAAIEGGEQPHAHIMFSERTIDRIERSREQFFKRYNPKDPSKGGCQKANSGRSHQQTKEDLIALRARFAELQNKHLAKAGHQVRVTHLSLKAQGIDREPEEHQGAARARVLKHEIRETRAQQARHLTHAMPINPPEVEQPKPPVITQQRIEDGAARLLARAAQRAAERAEVLQAQQRLEMLAKVAREKEAARQEANKPEPDRGYSPSR